MYLIIFLGGAMIGQILAALPGALFIDNKTEVSREDFMSAHPELKWVAYTMRATTLLSGLPMFFFFCFFLIGEYKTHAQAVVLFFPLFMILGVGLANAFYEIHSGVTGFVYDNKASYLVHPNARNCGLARIGIFTLVTIAAFYFCRLS
jgi:hypothetical protein